MDTKNIFLGLTIGVLGYLSYLMVKPFLGYIIGAMLLAFIVRPAHKKLENLVGENISAFALVMLSILAIILPFAITISAVANDAKDLQGDIDRSDFVNVSEIDQKITGITGEEIDIESKLKDSVSDFSASFLGGASQILKKVTNLMIGITLMLFLMFYLIRDGEVLLEWLKDVIPVEEEIQQSYFDKLSTTTWAVVKGHVLVALAQGVIAGIGLGLTGVPNYIFWTFVMVLLGFIPVIGTIIVWLPAAVYLFIKGDVAMSVALLIYGFTIISLVDNILRPLVVDRKADLHPASIIVGVLGGLVVFGAVGMFIGPIIIGALKSIILVAKNH